MAAQFTFTALLYVGAVLGAVPIAPNGMTAAAVGDYTATVNRTASSTLLSSARPSSIAVPPSASDNRTSFVTSKSTSSPDTCLISPTGTTSTVPSQMTIAVQTSAAPRPDCPEPPSWILSNGTDHYQAAYVLYHTGYGNIENASEPRDDTNTPITLSFPSSEDVTHAAIDCTQDASRGHPAQFYLSFDLHYNFTSQQWQCVEYHESNANVTWFNVTAPDVGCVFGYSVQ